MPTKHVCKDADHISKLAADQGFEHWKTVWDANGSLSSKRSNPNILFKGDKLNPAGDTVTIPDHDPGSKDAVTEIFNAFSTASDKLFLRLRILKDDFTALANAQYTLTITGIAPAPLFTGKTNAQGQIEKEIPRGCTSATLTVSVPAAPAPGGAGSCAESPVTWQLQIGRLNPIMENAPTKFCVSGVQQRLNNLGISTGPVDGINGKLTDAAIRVFQRLFKLGVDGTPGQGETQPKLFDVHDKPDSILGPLAPPNDSQSQKTPDDAIGHVACDFDDRKIFNTLRLRSAYRLTLRLGSVEELFPHKPDTDEGRMERAQVVGLFYFPVGHKMAKQAFKGITATGTTPAVRGVWEHFKTRILDNADDAAADKELQRLLQEWLVAGGKFPPPTADGATPKDENFIKLRQPGGYTFLASWGNPALELVNGDPRPPYRNWGWNNKNLYEAESRYFVDNPVMGKIPLIAKVERFDQATCEWKPAEKATVYFQLLDPDPLPAFRPADPVTSQFNRPPLRNTSVGPVVAAAGTAGPDHFASPEENPTGARAPKATDPQRGNCPSDRGGKQGSGSIDDGSDVANNIFSTASVPGFNAAHQKPASGSVNPITRTVFFPIAQRVNDTDRKHCVKAVTNSEGEAGVIFSPSRCGGDRYRFRAFLGPPTVNGPGSNGKGEAALAIDTGTFVLWRHLRISRYVQQPVGTPDPAMVADAVANLSTPTRTIASANDVLRLVSVINSAGTNVGLPTAILSTTLNAGSQFSSLPVQWARAFIEVEIDRAVAATVPEILTQAEWQAARQQGLADGIAGMKKVGVKLDLAKLLYMDPSAPASIDVNSAIFHFPMRSSVAYHNSLTPAQVAQKMKIGDPGNVVDVTIRSVLEGYVLGGFIRTLSCNGYLPGLAIVHGAMNFTWAISNGPNNHYPRNSGLAFEHRGGFVWFGTATYVNFSYDFTSNVCHELGHCMYRDHGAPPEPPGSGSAAKHDPPANNLSVCVMSYQPCEGQFCSKCIFSFRGWDFSKLPY